MYMVILEGLSEVDGYDFEEHDMMLCVALKGLTNKYFSLTKRSFMKIFYLHNKIYYDKSQAFEIVETKMTEGMVHLVQWKPKTTSMLVNVDY